MRARRIGSRGFATAVPHQALLTRDVDARTGLCAGGLVRIGVAPGKGLGAFAAQTIMPGARELVRYEGEVYRGMRGLHLRYGREGTVPFRAGPKGASPEDIEWHEQWRLERERRAVGVTGQYVFNAGTDHSTGLVIMVDAEDHQHPDTSWARFVNHSRTEPNLKCRCELDVDGGDVVPVVRLIVSRAIESGEELLMDYGGSMGEFVDAQ